MYSYSKGSGGFHLNTVWLSWKNNKALFQNINTYNCVACYYWKMKIFMERESVFLCRLITLCKTTASLVTETRGNSSVVRQADFRTLPNKRHWKRLRSSAVLGVSNECCDSREGGFIMCQLRVRNYHGASFWTRRSYAFYKSPYTSSSHVFLVKRAHAHTCQRYTEKDDLPLFHF